jgi:hypothetical protein
MLGEVPKLSLDKIIKKPLTAESQVKEPLSLEEKSKKLFLRAKNMIQFYGDGDDGSRETDMLFIDMGNNERATLQLIENKLEPNSYTIKTETWFTNKVGGGDRKELDISINEVRIKWGEKDASPEEVDTSLDLLEYLSKSGLSPAMSPWERRRVQEEMKLGIPFMMRQQDLDRWHNDRYD